MSIDREDVLLAFRALKRGALPAGDLRKAFRKQNALSLRKPLFEVLRADLHVPEDQIAPLRALDLRPDPKSDRDVLDEISKILSDEGIASGPEFEKVVATTFASPATASHPPLAVPQKLGDYEVRWEMGRGARSVVFRGFHPTHGDVALKIFRPGQAPQGFEVRVSEPHAGLVRLIQIGEAGGFTFLVMELVEGQPISKLLGARKVNAKEALELCEKAAKTLAELEAKGHHHGSLRSADLFVQKNAVRIKDFGGVAGSSEGDVKAFGEVLYEAATSVPPWGRDESREIRPPAPSAVNKSLDPQADALVFGAIDGRYPTMQAVLDDLGRFLRGEKLLMTAPAAKRGRKAGLIAAAVIAVLLVGAAIAAVVLRKDPPKPEPTPVEPKKESKVDPKPDEEKKPVEEEKKPVEEKKPEEEKKDPSGPMTLSEEREIEERCYRAKQSDLEELGRLSGMAVRRGPKRAWSEYYFAQFLFLKGRYAEALPHADEAVAMNPESVPYQELRGRVLLLRGEYTRAREDFKRRFDKKFQEITEQIKQITELIRANDGDGGLYLERGLFWDLRGDEVRAENDYAMAANRKTAVAWLYRARIRERQGKFPEALADVRRFLLECPDSAGRAEAEALQADLDRRDK